MLDSNEKKVYMQIGLGRLLDIQVILDGNLVYDGMVEDAPEEIKRLKYSNVENSGAKFIYYVYSELN